MKLLGRVTRESILRLVCDADQRKASTLVQELARNLTVEQAAHWGRNA